MALLLMIGALVVFDVLALRLGAESRDGFTPRRGGSGRLVVGWRR